jgi:prefoldin subunit 5
MELNREYLETKIKECKEALEQLKANANAYTGAIQMLEKIIQDMSEPAS